MTSPFRSIALVIKVMTAHLSVIASTVSVKSVRAKKGALATTPTNALRGSPVTLRISARPVLGERGASVMQNACVTPVSIALMEASASLAGSKG